MKIVIIGEFVITMPITQNAGASNSTSDSRNSRNGVKGLYFLGNDRKKSPEMPPSKISETRRRKICMQCCRSSTTKKCMLWWQLQSGRQLCDEKKSCLFSHRHCHKNVGKSFTIFAAFANPNIQVLPLIGHQTQSTTPLRKTRTSPNTRECTLESLKN